jgi:hypothetical protein
MRRLLVIVVPLVLVLAGCSTSSDPTATYTGGACTYDGPSEFDVDSEVTFILIDETESGNTGLVLWLVDDGTTPEMIHDEGVDNLSETQVSLREYQFTASFEQPGTYALNCYDTSGGENDGAGLDYSTILTASE